MGGVWKEEKAREKLTERQEVVLSFVEKRRKDDGIFTTSNDLILHLNDEFKGDKTKALASLNQLEKKKLIQSNKRNFDGKGLIKIFFTPN